MLSTLENSGDRRKTTVQWGPIAWDKGCRSFFDCGLIVECARFLCRLVLPNMGNKGYIVPIETREQFFAEQRRIRQIENAKEQRRDDFGRKNNLKLYKWSGFNLSRFINRVATSVDCHEEIRSIFGALGMSCGAGWKNRNNFYPGTGGVFDHGHMWGRSGKPCTIVGHPYDIDDREKGLLIELARDYNIDTLFSEDEKLSYYGFGTWHVRIDLRTRLGPIDHAAPSPSNMVSPGQG